MNKQLQDEFVFYEKANSEEVDNYKPDFEDVLFLTRLYDSNTQFGPDFDSIAAGSTVQHLPIDNSTVESLAFSITQSGIEPNLNPYPEDLMVYLCLAHLRKEEFCLPDEIKDLLNMDILPYEDQVSEFINNPGEFFKNSMDQLKLLTRSADISHLQRNLTSLFKMRGGGMPGVGTVEHRKESLGDKARNDKLDPEAFTLIPPIIINTNINLPGNRSLNIDISLPVTLFEKNRIPDREHHNRAFLLSGKPYHPRNLEIAHYSVYGSLLHLVVGQFVASYETEGTKLDEQLYVKQRDLNLDLSQYIDNIFGKVHLLHVHGGHWQKTDFLHVAGPTYGTKDYYAYQNLKIMKYNAIVFLEKAYKLMQEPEIKKALYLRRKRFTDAKEQQKNHNKSRLWEN